MSTDKAALAAEFNKALQDGKFYDALDKYCPGLEDCEYFEIQNALAKHGLRLRVEPIESECECAWIADVKDCPMHGVTK